MLIKLNDSQLHRGSIEFHKQIVFDLSLEEAEKLVADAEKMFGKEQCTKMDIYEALEFRQEHEAFHAEFETQRNKVWSFNIDDFSDFEGKSKVKQQNFLKEAEKMLNSVHELNIKISW